MFDAKPVVGTHSKGKLREDTVWNAGWWDFYPLAENPRRPVEWSNSSVIFTAHALQPQIIARHFSSSKQFSIPAPLQIAQDPSNYDPPTVITASKDDRWLFAFFPGKGKDGICCLWQRGIELDNWSVKESWSSASGAGVVTASWLGGPREWIVDPNTGASTRLPSRGPAAPIFKLTLALVTQDHRFHVCYLRQYLSAIKMLSCSLLEPSNSSERQPDNSQDSLDDANSVRICINAAIGTTYGDSSILVAMRSQVFPLPLSSPAPGEFPLDLNLSLESESDHTEPYLTVQEDCVEDSLIQVVEVQLQFDGITMGLSSKIYPAVEDAPNMLRELCFVSQPSLPNIHLVASFIDFKDYTSLPVSRIKCYSFAKSETSSWTIQPGVARDFESGILAHVAPSQPSNGERGIYVSIYDITGTQPQQKLRQAEFTVGNLKVLKIPDLVDDESWEDSPIISPVRRIEREVPVGIVISPGQTLLCMIFSSPWSSQMSVQKLPRRTTESSIPLLALSFVTATLAQHSTEDLTHALLQPSLPPTEMTETLYQVFNLLDRHFPGDFTLQLGLIIECYRSRALRASKSNIQEREKALAIWRAAHDMASVVACNEVFGDCINEDESYQIDLHWQLNDLSSWILSLLEKLVKECILSSEFNDPVSSADDDLFSPTSKTSRFLDSTMFLHLVHPTALRNLRTALGHVKHYRKYVAELAPRTENAQLSRDVLLDLVECSGIDLQGLDSLLDMLSGSVQEFNDDDVRRALASCQPSFSMQPPLRDLVNTMAQSPALNKARLFVKSYEMIDGQTHMPFDRPQKDKSRDVVSKGILTHRGQAMTCLRCGGQTEYGKDLKAIKTLAMWEKSRARKCVCGGSWSI